MSSYAEAFDKQRRIRCVMDGTSWLYELGEAPQVPLFGNEEDIKEFRNCLDTCGIVEVEVRLVRWVQQPGRPRKRAAGGQGEGERRP